MGKPKKYLIKPINFGKHGDRARRIIEAFEKKHGKQKTSKMVRDLLISRNSTAKEFQESQTKLLIKEREEFKRIMVEIQSKILRNSNDLEKLGLNSEDVDFK